MSVTIIATPGAEDANSFLTLEEAQALASTFMYLDNWLDATEDDQKRALIGASRSITLQRLKGRRHTLFQSLAFPRDEVPQIEGDYTPSGEVPRRIKEATLLIANEMLGGNQNKNIGNIQRFRDDEVEIHYRDQAGTAYFTPEIFDLLEPYISYAGQFAIVRG